MAEVLCSSESKTQKGLFTESDMEAAQQLMQLSDEDSNDNITGKRDRSSYEEVDQRLSDITLAKIHEIFGKDEVFPPKKQRRYRSLVNIYMETRPINAGNGRKVSTPEKERKTK